MKAGTLIRTLAGTLVLAALAVAGTGAMGAISTARAGTVPQFSFTVDGTVKPQVAALDLAGVIGPDGSQVDFHVNELTVATADPKALASLLARWNGTIVSTVDPGTLAKQGLVPEYLVKIDSSLADPKELAADLDAMKAGPPGAYRVSSSAGLATLVAAAHETAVDGITTGVDFLLTSDTIRTRSTLEAATLPSDGSYGSNAYTWPGYSSSVLPGSRVGEAWNLLARAGRLPDDAHRIPIGIIDSGFSTTNNDLSPASTFAVQRRSTIPCSGGSRCPWHGTMVASAAADRVDDHNGAAGTGGPVARAVEIDRDLNDDGSVFGMFAAAVSTFVSTGGAAANGTHIFNMSFGAPIPAGISFITTPIQIGLRMLHDSGSILVASAGNSSTDVDALDCFGICWKRTFWFPCASTGVLCVGGTAFAAETVAPPSCPTCSDGSNFGTAHDADSVDVWAPFDAAVGSDPDHSSNLIQHVGGTSFSAPFVAGVAALVWAANPTLTAAQVESTLISTAHAGAGPASRIVDAQAAVSQALGPDLPPDITITAPTSGQLVGRSGWMILTATATDREDGTPRIAWSIDGNTVPGNTPVVGVPPFSLGYGMHTVRAVATDTAGHSVADSAGGVSFTIGCPTYYTVC